MSNTTLGGWIRDNPAVIVQFVLMMLGIGVMWGQLSQEQAEDRVRRAKSEERLAAVEAKVQPMDTYTYRLTILEKSVQDGNSRLDRLQATFLDASSKMADRLTRIETLVEQVLEAQGVSPARPREKLGR